MKTAIIAALVIAALNAPAEKVILYNKETGAVEHVLPEGSKVSGVNPALAVVSSATAKGSEKHINELPDAKEVKSESELLREALTVIADETKSKAEKQAKIEEVVAAIEKRK